MAMETPGGAASPVEQRVQLVALGEFVGGRHRAPQGNLHPGEILRKIRGVAPRYTTHFGGQETCV